MQSSGHGPALTPQQAAAWLRQRGLATPALLAVEVAEPLRWLLAQVGLMLVPMGRGLGGGALGTALMTWLESPEQFAELRAALAQEVEEG